MTEFHPAPYAAVWLFCAALNPFAGILHVLSEAVGSPAADSDNGEESSDQEQKNETFYERGLICFHNVIVKPEIRAGAMRCSPHRMASMNGL